MKTNLRTGLNTGITFGIVMIFLFLVGFTFTMAGLIVNLLKLAKDAVILGLNPQMFSQAIFLTLIGLWAGARGAAKHDEHDGDPWLPALTGALTAGLIVGLMIGALAYLLGTLNENGIKVSKYLAQILPDVVKLFLYGKSPLQGAITHFVFFTVTGLLGGLLARGLFRGRSQAAISKWRDQAAGAIDSNPVIRAVRTHPATRYILYGLLILVVILTPLSVNKFWNYTIGTIGIYVLLGLGLNIVVGLAGLLDLGYVAFFAIGAYSVALLTAPKPHDLMWSFWLAMLIGVALAASAGILLGIPVLRMRGDYLAIVTLGFGEIIRVLSKSDLLTPFSGGPKGVSGVGMPTLFGKPFTDVHFVYLIILAVLLVIFVTRRLQNSRVGRAWEAMREDEIVARAMGINTLTHKLLAFAIGAAFAGLGGAIFASRNQFTGPEDHNLMVSINVLALVIVGGMGSIPGVIAGAFVLKGLPEILRELENYRVMVFGALLVVMMLIRPEGIIPSSRRKLEVGREEPEESLTDGGPQK
jgi:branched-chain amino acid transport system permease protein